MEKTPGAWAIEAGALVRRFGETHALAGVDLTVRPGEFFSLLGPSGCGKTTLLRIIAGLDHPDSGTLRIGGADALPIPAHRRPVNTVFQSYALFPHLNVYHNIGFGLRMKRLPRAEVHERVVRIMDLVQISRLQNRRPAQLSGGEKQRVALARAVVNEPQILLLDEPLAALDLALRQQLQLELRQVQRRLGITFLYVTHDQDEALKLSDRIAVLQAGRIEQVGTSEDLYERPGSRFVAEFLGGCNLLETSPHTDPGTLTTPCGDLKITGGKIKGRVTLAIRPEKVVLDADSGEANVISVVVRETIYHGAETQYWLEAGGIRLRATLLNSDAGPARRFQVGAKLNIALPPAALIVLPDHPA